METTDFERLVEIRRRWYEAHVRRFEADPAAVHDPASARPSLDEPSDAPVATGAAASVDETPEAPVTGDARAFLACVAGSPDEDPSGGDRWALRAARAMDTDSDRFRAVAAWWKRERPAFLHPALAELCELADEPNMSAAITDAVANQLKVVADHLGRALVDDLSEAAGERLEASVGSDIWTSWNSAPPPDPNVHWCKSDLRVDWKNQDLPPKKCWPGLRLWLNRNGVAVGIGPGFVKGGVPRARKIIVARRLDGFEELTNSDTREGRKAVGFSSRSQQFLYGRWFVSDELADLDLPAIGRDVVIATRLHLQEMIAHAVGASKKTVSPPSRGAVATAQNKTVDSLEARLARVAADLLIDVEFLRDIVALLEDKRQVIFYGPPGTGKTYLARALAEALAPDSASRSLVQFHPATSYEDFFEGYRPVKRTDGRVAYELVPGPLARMVEKAEQAEKAASTNASDPAGALGAAARIDDSAGAVNTAVLADDPAGTVDAAEQTGQAKHNSWPAAARHAMVIDEINRANLPKVLGELLFLLEYRDERTPTLYRPDAEFALPGNLWFIGTMNTADRSIALVDAVLRRRFHFVPFFPDHGPMAGLLNRWLDANGAPAWVGELVAMVNRELAEALGGSHLQLGASHFMKRGLDRNTLRRIWQYNVEPFIEDQLFGDAERIARFRFDEVYARWQIQRDGAASIDDLPGDSADETSNQADDESPHDHSVASPAAASGDPAGDDRPDDSSP